MAKVVRSEGRLSFLVNPTVFLAVFQPEGIPIAVGHEGAFVTVIADVRKEPFTRMAVHPIFQRLSERLDDRHGYVTRKLLQLFGDGDCADELIAQMDAEEIERGHVLQEEAENPPKEDGEE